MNDLVGLNLGLNPQTFHQPHNKFIRIKVGRVGVIGLVLNQLHLIIVFFYRLKAQGKLFINLDLKNKLNGIHIVNQKINQMKFHQALKKFIKIKVGKV